MTFDPRRLRQGVQVMAVVVAVLWAIELVNLASGNALNGLGVTGRSLTGLLGIIVAPLLHTGIAHLVANTLPVFILGTALWMSGRREFTVATAVSWVSSGLLAWVLMPPGYVGVGASGVIFGWLAYLVLRGFLTRDIAHVLVGVGVAVLYGTTLFGVFPQGATLSWQAHLGGAIGGVLAAFLLFRRRR